MELYLSGSITNDEWNQLEEQGVLFLLQTFYEMKSWKEEKIKRALNCCDTFMLDSGAFTFMNSGKKVHWKTYVDEYIEFINKYDIQHFIELDLYGVLGVEKNREDKKIYRTLHRKETNSCLSWNNAGFLFPYVMSEISLCCYVSNRNN